MPIGRGGASKVDLNKALPKFDLNLLVLNYAKLRLVNINLIDKVNKHYINLTLFLQMFDQISVYLINKKYQLALFILKRGSKWRRFGACSFKIKNFRNDTILTLSFIPTPFLVVFNPTIPQKIALASVVL